jgi:hypothetical protein
MDRRAFISGITGGFLAAPLAAQAQLAGKVRRGYRSGFSSKSRTDTPEGEDHI